MKDKCENLLQAIQVVSNSYDTLDATPKQSVANVSKTASDGMLDFETMFKYIRASWLILGVVPYVKASCVVR